ncbi:hypothetical protein HNY73_011480 [Argiope bruennichi]|uniref:Uncharacterized protein n=1 Tax=Argiope bruennichi TaxID=94029 RepID=A0A8T0F9D4_ARGBR|nr:hypothetical protein HNY73_011480 [Argiope bruennichi]
MAVDGFGLDRKDFRTRTNRLSKNEEMANASELLVLNKERDLQGIIRVRTKLIHREDSEIFKTSALLPSCHTIVERLVMTVHTKNLDARTQILLNILREQYWILNSGRIIGRVISKCVTYKRWKEKHLNAAVALLPPERVNDPASVMKPIRSCEVRSVDIVEVTSQIRPPDFAKSS